METEYGIITTSTSENMSSNEGNCLGSSNIESTQESVIKPTKMQTLQLKLTLLKQHLKATSVKVKWLKKNHSRQVIDNKFISNTKPIYCDLKVSL